MLGKWNNHLYRLFSFHLFVAASTIARIPPRAKTTAWDNEDQDRRYRTDGLRFSMSGILFVNPSLFGEDSLEIFPSDRRVKTAAPTSTRSSPTNKGCLTTIDFRQV